MTKIILMREGESDSNSDILRNSRKVEEVALRIQALAVGNIGLISSSQDFRRDNVVDSTSQKVIEVLQCSDLGTIRGGPYNILQELFRDLPHFQTIVFIGTLKAGIKSIYSTYSQIIDGLNPSSANLDEALGYEIIDGSRFDDDAMRRLEELIAEEAEKQKRDSKMMDTYFDL